MNDGINDNSSHKVHWIQCMSDGNGVYRHSFIQERKKCRDRHFSHDRDQKSWQVALVKFGWRMKKLFFQIHPIQNGLLYKIPRETLGYYILPSKKFFFIVRDRI